jgi:transcription antitermination factor NusG
MFPIPKRYRLEHIDRSLKWHILWVNSRQYQTQTYSFLDGYAAWIPEKKVTSRSGDDCLEISEPLFPGYIFVGVHSAASLSSIETAARKAGLCFYFLRTNHRHYSMTYLELERMVRNGYDSATPTYDKGIRVGRQVRITVGPYTGVVGKVTLMTKKDIQVKATCLKKELLIVVHRTNYQVLEPA